MAQYAGRASVGLHTQASLTILSTSTIFRHRMAQYAGRASVGLHTQASLTLLSTSFTTWRSTRLCWPAHSGKSNTSLYLLHRMAQYAGRASVGLHTQASLTILSTSTIFRHRMAQYAGRASVGLQSGKSNTSL